METTVGIFRSQTDTERAWAQLKALGIGYDKITMLRPGTTNRQVEAAVQTSDTEGSGMGAAMGGTVGGAIGAGAGASLGAAIVGLFVPGVGPIIAAGVLGAALLGTGGALAGVQAGSLFEGNLASGLPHDELFVYEDALRNGRSLGVVLSDDHETTERVHDALARAGAESVDAARESWWLGLRETEQQEYERTHNSFTEDEYYYRLGFEAALHAKTRCKEFDQVSAEMASNLEELQDQYPGADLEEAYTRGYQRGREYYQHLCDEKRAA